MTANATLAALPMNRDDPDAGPAGALLALRAVERRDGPLALDHRRALLAALGAEVLRRGGDLVAALDADYGGRCAEETLLAEVKLVANAAGHARARLRGWAVPRRAAIPLPFWPARAAILPVPKGIVGIMAPWNYPVQLLLLPAIDALAAGNRVALKPSEAVPRTAALLVEIVGAALGADVARTVLGGPAIAEAFAAQPWDHLVFTGGTETGRKVMRAAAAHLTPLTLELGGKCPVVVLPGADLPRAARAIMAGKAVNAGQTCIAPDTVLLVGHNRAAFVAACRATGIGAETAVVNAAQRDRLASLAAGATVTPVGAGGLATIEAPDSHALHASEIFGPLLAVVEVVGLPGVLAWIAAQPAPLAIYLFGATRAEAAMLTERTRSGAIVEERCVEYAAFPGLAFGGVGASGFGRRGGQAGFEEFSNRRAMVRHGGWALSRLFDPPRTARTRAMIRRVVGAPD